MADYASLIRPTGNFEFIDVITVFAMETVSLANGICMPKMGLGVFRIEDQAAMDNAVEAAVSAGYRNFDTAFDYGNESFLTNSLSQCGVLREDVFITTKLPNSMQRTDDSLRAFEKSLENLQADYVDLYLMHWAIEGHYLQAWEDMLTIYESGRAKAIGVCNFMPHHLDALAERFDCLPMVNQFENHPFLHRKELIAYCHKNDIQPQAHTPLTHGKLLVDPELLAMAEHYKKTVAQLILRWDIQQGLMVVPKSSNPTRIRENADIWDFEINDRDMEVINDKHSNEMICLDPDNVTW
ncbi:aldo/keto reductase [Porticoccus sp. GXU_MW_L64]